jgi:hypothetical protein
MADADYSDVFADGLGVNAGAYGVAITFLLSDPIKGPQEPGLPGAIVGRVRLSPALARALIQLLTESLDKMPQESLSLGTNDQ